MIPNTNPEIANTLPLYPFLVCAIPIAAKIIARMPNTIDIKARKMKMNERKRPIRPRMNDATAKPDVFIGGRNGG